MRPSGPKAMPFHQADFLLSVWSVFFFLNFVPFQPLHTWSFGPVVMYSLPLRQAMPKTAAGEPGTRVAEPLLITKTPPGGPPGSSDPPAAVKSVPPAKANSVGVGMPWASVCTVAPLAAVGGGGPWAPAVPARTRRTVTAPARMDGKRITRVLLHVGVVCGGS